MKLRSLLLMLPPAFSLLASAAMAEERFYQVIDASGRVQIIKGSTAGKTAVPASDKSAVVTGGAPSSSVSEPSKVVPSPKSSGDVSSGKQGQLDNASPYADYDGDEFVSSEQMDAAHQTDSRAKFYVVSDAAGTRYESISGGEGAVNPLPVSEIQPRSYIDLKDNYASLQSFSDINQGKACFSEKQMSSAEELDSDKMMDVLFAASFKAHISAKSPVQLYRVKGEGFGALQVRSYALKDENPAFVMPLMAFANADGCITRVVDGYFQRYYAPTISKHPMLEAELILHAEDVYVVLMMPEVSPAGTKKGLEYRVGSLGRVSVKWQK